MTDSSPTLWLDLYAMPMGLDGSHDLVEGLQITVHQWQQIAQIIGFDDPLLVVEWALQGRFPPQIEAQLAVPEIDSHMDTTADARARRAEWEVEGSHG